jgi:hypothetical protein
MRKFVASKLSPVLLMAAVFMMSGCKKEAVVKTIAPVTVGSDATDSTNYLKGYFDGAPISFQGNAYAYHAFVDPDSAQNGGNHNNHDHDVFYQSGSKWINLTNTGLQVINASLELRSLAVRVFVSPIATVSTGYYNLLNPANYPVSDDDNSSQGAYITLHDKYGVLWTSHGDQDGSTMVILTRGANMTTYTVISGTISCKLYDGEGNMKKLTAASFTAAVGI